MKKQERDIHELRLTGSIESIEARLARLVDEGKMTQEVADKKLDWHLYLQEYNAEPQGCHTSGLQVKVGYDQVQVVVGGRVPRARSAE